MSNSTCETKNPLQRDGTSQQQRMLEALDPATVKVHEFSLKNWMQFAWQYAQQLNYFSTQNERVAQGNWSDFLKSASEIESWLQQIQSPESTATVEPHLALLLSFFKLMDEPIGLMNGLTKKHLDFYYKEILQLKGKQAAADRVHLIFELAKNVSSLKLEDNAMFDAGKDKGLPALPLQYKLADGPVIYPATVSALKSVIHLKERSIRAAVMANSLDGNGAPLHKENPVWYGFGFDTVPVEPGSNEVLQLPEALLGFALASPVLRLQQGRRVITLTLNLDNLPATIDFAVFKYLQRQLIVLITGEDDWVSPASITVLKTPEAKVRLLQLQIVVDTEEKAIVGYNKKLHKENYNTDAPVIRLLLKASPGEGYSLWKALSRCSLASCNITVSVTGLREVVVENDEGRLDAAKPFLPFTAQPKPGSDFYIGSSEIFQKNWSNVSLNLEWKGKPLSLADHYKAYQNSFLSNSFSRNAYDLTAANIDTVTDAAIQSDDDFLVATSYIQNGKWSDAVEKNLFTDVPISINKSAGFLSTPSPKINATLAAGFASIAGITVLQQHVLNTPKSVRLSPASFKTINRTVGAEDKNFTTTTKNNFLRLRLASDFFHSKYPLLYAAAITIPGAVIPAMPYTPMVAALSVSYTASAFCMFKFDAVSSAVKLQNYQQKSIQFFHEHPFGQSEQHVFLKEQQSFEVGSPDITLLPKYSSDGECYIGISNAMPDTLLSLLFQVAEGSENPMSPTFANKKIKWYALCNNDWKFLNDDFIVADDTNNFLQPGIIQFLLPKEINSDNTLLPGALYWIKAQLPEGIPTDAVCKFIAVVAQAHEAVFVNNGNELSHLSTALAAGTISKMINKQSALKGVTQPFNSFGGQPAETDEHFYIRVSERLRHKNRAVTIWDYERLVLEKFPGIYKVKCLNHTSSQFELSPGSVRIIPIPDIRNKNLYNILQPRVSRNTLNQIEQYLSTLIGFHVDCKAENPAFEQVQFDFKVKFYEAFDPVGYLKILNEDLKKYLSPWAYDTAAAIQFGGTLNSSKVVAFIESLPYVDYIADFKMYHLRFGKRRMGQIAAGNSRAILTSCKSHVIVSIQPPVCA